MADLRIRKHSPVKTGHFTYKLLLCTILGILFISCASVDIKREIQIPKEEVTSEQTPPEPIPIPDLVPVHEDVSPLKTKIVDISARNTPLRDVLFIISEATDLNMIMENEINPELLITLNLKNVTAEDALNRVCSVADYFYTVKDNMLSIKATSTKIYELGYPAVVQTYNTDLGGDMLGGATLGTGGSSNVKGNITQKTETDKSAYNFWDVIEKALEKIINASPVPSSAARQSFTVNRLTGTIIVTATKKTLENIDTYINTIKKIINRQVLVEAKIIEVNLSDGLQFGIDWNYVLHSREGRSETFATGQFADVVTPTAPNFSITTVASDFTSLLRAIQTQGETRILSNPRISIMNGQTSILSVGQNTNFISKIETTTTTGTTPVTTFTITTNSLLSGIMIGIVPFISENGDVSLTITPITSDLTKLDERKIGTPDSSGNYPFLIQLPTTALRQLSTTVKVKNRQMVIIGGLISEKELIENSKVPWLGDIPGLGYLFKSKTKKVTKSELVVLIQPVIISTR
ncbi:MAG: pilus (MSHA type) biogenesis protein MshL [Syntrophales bacterium]